MFYRNSLFLALIAFMFCACVKDVEMDQYKEIVLPPTAALDLVYFSLHQEDFSSRVTVTDETRLDFLDDDYIQESLVGADFNFVIQNSFSSDFTLKVMFLSQGKNLQHSFEILVPGAVDGKPSFINYTEKIPEQDIGVIRRSLYLQIQVQKMESFQEPGTLELESKAFYQFEFK